MTENLEKYFNIMERYRKGEFGTDNLTMHDILEKARENNLIESMTTYEINYLISSSSGITKMLFECELKKRQDSISLTRKRELY